MPARETDALVKSVQSLATEKEAVAAKERQLIVRLGAALVKIGYRVVAMDRSDPERAGRVGGRRRARRRMNQAARKAVSRRMKAYWAKRRNQPPKVKAGRRGRRQGRTAAR
jgi:hypothetical protein